MFTVNVNFMPTQLKRRVISPSFSGAGLPHTVHAHTLSHKDSFHRTNHAHSAPPASALASKLKGFADEEEEKKKE